MKASIVIGLGFGDEGKGSTVNSLITYDYTDMNKQSVVIRFSGGQQAGHTVIHNGTKHIHASYGSGTLKGIPTYISEHCTVDPQAMKIEYDTLIKKGVDVPNITIHPLAMLTTPFDTFANIQDSQNKLDGTCGMGVGKTMKRNEGPYKLYAIDLQFEDILRKKLQEIADHYGFSWHYIDEYINDIQQLKFDIKGYEYIKGYDDLIFEGSQGVMLDMDHGIFPNVTYANTTSKNALEIINTLGIDNIKIYYITRSYQTRHGNGWMSSENKLNLINNEEEINVEGPYQGEFRVGTLDYDLLAYAMKIDNIYSSHILDKTMVVTCMDQFEDFKFDEGKFNMPMIYSSSPEGFELTSAQALLTENKPPLIINL
jgi:adenylosuccinate synthase